MATMDTHGILVKFDVDPLSNLVGQVAVVTGGSRGIGAHVSAVLVSRGINVVICGRSMESLEQARDRVIHESTNAVTVGRIETIQADVRNAEQAQLVIDHATTSFGGLDILVNNAGVIRFQDLATQSVEEWCEIMETNLNGVFFCCRAAIPALRRRGGGWIINVSSLAGSHPFSGGGAYCASKAGVDALSEALMQELRHEKIRVSCVAPGSVDTRTMDTLSREAGWKLTAADVAQVIVDLLQHDSRSLPSRIEVRPARPQP